MYLRKIAILTIILMCSMSSVSCVFDNRTSVDNQSENMNDRNNENSEKIAIQQKHGREAMNETMNYIFGGGQLENVINTLGPPNKKVALSECEPWYFNQGVEIDVVGQNDIPMIFNYVYLSSSSPLKTYRNVGIGTEKEKVLRSYQKEVNQADTNNDYIVVGTTKLGIIFEIKGNKVNSIFIAEGRFTMSGDNLDERIRE